MMTSKPVVVTFRIFRSAGSVPSVVGVTKTTGATSNGLLNVTA